MENFKVIIVEDVPLELKGTEGIFKNDIPEAEIIGPIQMGLNKPIHFTDSESSVQDIVNITAVAVIDAYVEKIKKQK